MRKLLHLFKALIVIVMELYWAFKMSQKNWSLLTSCITFFRSCKKAQITELSRTFPNKNSALIQSNVPPLHLKTINNFFDIKNQFSTLRIKSKITKNFSFLFIELQAISSQNFIWNFINFFFHTMDFFSILFIQIFVTMKTHNNFTFIFL